VRLYSPTMHARLACRDKRGCLALSSRICGFLIFSGLPVQSNNSRWRAIMIASKPVASKLPPAILASAGKVHLDPRASPPSLDQRLRGRRQIARKSCGAASGQYGGDRLPQDLQIQAERPVLDVAQVESNGVNALQVGASADLPEPGETWGHQ
jgi:hypothetical protein